MDAQQLKIIRVGDMIKAQLTVSDVGGNFVRCRGFGDGIVMEKDIIEVIPAKPKVGDTMRYGSNGTNYLITAIDPDGNWLVKTQIPALGEGSLWGIAVKDQSPYRLV